jgi:hypothetical protein
MKMKKFILPAAAVLAAAMTATPSEARGRAELRGSGRTAEARHPAPRVPGHARPVQRGFPGGTVGYVFVGNAGAFPGYVPDMVAPLGGFAGVVCPPGFGVVDYGLGPNVMRFGLPSGACRRVRPICAGGWGAFPGYVPSDYVPVAEEVVPEVNDTEEPAVEPQAERRGQKREEAAGTGPEPKPEKPLHLFGYKKCIAGNQIPAEAHDFLNAFYRAIGEDDTGAYVMGFGENQYIAAKKHGKILYVVTLKHNHYESMADLEAYLFGVATEHHGKNPRDVMDIGHRTENDPTTCPANLR